MNIIENYQVVVVGDGAVGKTCLCTVYTQVCFAKGMFPFILSWAEDNLENIFVQMFFFPENLPNQLQSNCVWHLPHRYGACGRGKNSE